MHGEQKAEAKAVEEGEEVSARLEQAVADKKQLEEDAFQVTKVRILMIDIQRDAARPSEAGGGRWKGLRQTRLDHSSFH